MVAMTAVGALGTTDHLAKDRFYFNGTTADVRINRNFIPPEQIENSILNHPEVVDDYQELLLYGQAPGQGDQPLALRLLAGDYQRFDFPIKEGRMIAAPGEAVMGYAVFELLKVEIGEAVEILVDGQPVEVTIVGRHLENLLLNHVILMDLETYRQQAKPEAETNTYYLRLEDRDAAETLRQQWLDHFQGLVSIHVIQEEPLVSVTQLTDLILSIAVILLLVAAANLMSNSLLTTRERVRDFGIQKTLGLTPTQIAISVVVGALAITVIALLLGVTLGLVIMEKFIQQVGIAIGAGTDYYIIDWGQLSLLLPILVLVAILSSLLPARRAAKIEVVDALRYE
jgi:putative ABC transport system permease protein